MPAKIDETLWIKRKDRIRQIMKDYSLTHNDVMLLLGVNYDKVKNWRDAKSFFTVAEEYRLLQMIKDHFLQFTDQVTKEINVIDFRNVV